jgi:hypothetical protein
MAHFVLESEGRSSDELRPAPIDEQEHHRVRGQHLLTAGEELVD